MIKAMIVILVILIVIVSFRWYFGTEKMYKDEVKKNLLNVKGGHTLITVKDIEYLPQQLQTYLINSKVIDSPKVSYFHVIMSGEMKLDKAKPYAPIKAEQYTFLESGKRLFFITMNYNKLPISGLHYYHSEDAFMKIKIMDLIKVADHSGEQMQRAETVTYFNDLCIMAPGGLLEEDITWEEIGHQQVRGTLRKHGHEISALLIFNDDGMLQNFISHDRLDVGSDGIEESVTWSTPMVSFDNIGDYYLPSAGEAIWHYPDEAFSYIKLKIEDVSVNK